ncbi:MAG TPA: hypothetical protein VHC19_23910 [Pirellulales bacterium]|nr:hypothetical protein [Pirellulales bacterium]
MPQNLAANANSSDASMQADDGARRRSQAAWLVAFVAVLLCGAAMRLAAAEDMEYKADEIWTFERTQPDPARPFPWIGMPSSAGMDNPGMSVWVFMALARLFHAHDPVSLARVVQALSIAAIGLQVLFAWRWAPRADREAWLWSAALLSVNPLAVLFHRKIWPPSVLPIFISLMLIAWWRRERRLSAFCWGLLGAVIGQIHLGGIHFAAGAALWTWWADRKRAAWKSWAVGSALGALPMIPWIKHLIATHGTRPAAPMKWQHIFEFKYWLRWFSEAFGWGIDYSLGDDFRDFLAQPVIGGQSTWLVAALHAACVALGGYLLVRWWRHWRVAEVDPSDNWRHSSTALAENIGLWGYGVMLTLTLTPIHCHYLIIVYPLEFLWVARLALGHGAEAARRRPSSRMLLACLCGAQLLISASFLGYVHARQVIHGDYGVVYQAQAERAGAQR